MKNIFYILLLLPTIIFAQYPSNSGQKITLGEQTTADGLVFRGVASIDTVTATSKITRANKQDTSAYLLLDTVTNLLWHYKTGSNAWTQAGGSTFDTTTLNLVSRFALKLNIADTSNIKYVNTYGTQTVNGAKTFTSAVTATKLNVTDSIQSNSGIYKINSSTLGLNVDNTTPFRITTGGNWGIYNDNPQNLLSTFSSSARGGVISNSYPILMFNEVGNSKFVFGLDANEGYLWGFANVKLIIATNNTEKMRIETNGNVGIGTNNPVSILHIEKALGTNISSSDQLRVSSGVSGDRAGIHLTDNITSDAFISFLPSATAANRIIELTCNGANGGISVDGNGRLGIGTTTQSVALHVVGNGRFTAVGSGTFGNNLNITSDGTLTTATSDEKYKYNILPINYGLSTILKLKPVNFKWIEGEEQDLGFIAQDVAEIIPEAVNTNWNSDLLMRYESIIPILTKAIQEQQALIKALEQRILNLENK